MNKILIAIGLICATVGSIFYGMQDEKLITPTTSLSIDKSVENGSPMKQITGDKNNKQQKITNKFPTSTVTKLNNVEKRRVIVQQKRAQEEVKVTARKIDPFMEEKIIKAGGKPDELIKSRSKKELAL